MENYARYRPGYPAQIVDLLCEDCGLTQDSVIADVGSGTGKLAEIFLKIGCRVFGVEPNKEMREAGERAPKDFPRFTSVDGTAEATTLPGQSADFITIGQAFHWFNHEQCRLEFSRILKPAGWIVIVWNDRRSDATPFLAAYEKLLQEFSTDYERVNHRRVDDAEMIRAFFKDEPRFKTFPNAQQFDFGGLKGRLLSSSYAPEAGEPRHDEMLAALENIFEAQQRSGRVAFEYETHVYYGRLL